MPAPSILFVSDAHFGLPRTPYEMERRKAFLRFLAAAHGVERLVIAGDLFQFWCDLGRTVPAGYFDILEGLASLRRSGTAIDYVAGNHDFWRGRFFPEELGVTLHPGPLRLETQGRHILVLHGDGEGPGDHGYKLLKAVVRQPLVRGIARLLHPDLLLGLAHRIDRWSHRRTAHRTPDRRRLQHVARRYLGSDCDAVVMGHVHVQLHEQHPEGDFLVLGDWLELRSFARLEGGRFHAERWER